MWKIKKKQKKTIGYYKIYSKMYKEIRIKKFWYFNVLRIKEILSITVFLAIF